MSGTIYVENAAQAVLFEDEIKGQISDGFWENASAPQDHWVAWCEAEVAIDPARAGRDFSVLKRGYLITDRRLLEVVGERMIAAVQEKASLPDYDHDALIKDLRRLRWIMRSRSPHTHDQHRRYSDGDSIAVIDCHGPNCAYEEGLR